MANNTYRRGIRSELPMYHDGAPSFVYLSSSDVVSAEMTERPSEVCRTQLSKEDIRLPSPLGHCANCVCVEECVLAWRNMYDCERYQEMIDNVYKYINDKLYEYLAGKDVENND